MNLVDVGLLHIHQQNPITIKRDAVLEELASRCGRSDGWRRIAGFDFGHVTQAVALDQMVGDDADFDRFAIDIHRPEQVNLRVDDFIALGL